MSNVAAHAMADVAARGLQGFALMHAAVDGVLGAIEDQREDDRHEVVKLVSELGRVRRVASAAQAEAARLTDENAALRAALARSRAALAGYAAALRSA